MSIVSNYTLSAEKNADLSLNRNSEIQGLPLKKNPNQLPKKETIEISRKNIENDAAISPFTLHLPLQWWLQYAENKNLLHYWTPFKKLMVRKKG